MHPHEQPTTFVAFQNQFTSVGRFWKPVSDVASPKQKEMGWVTRAARYTSELDPLTRDADVINK